MIELKAAYHWTLDELAAIFNEAFTGYIGGNVHFDAAGLARFLSWGNVDLALSQIITREGQPVGLGLISRQSGHSYLASMGVIPAAQEQGVGKAALAQLIAQARARGDQQFELEVIEQNERGVRLYDGAGFGRVRRLVGYEAEQPAGEPADLERVDISDVAKLIVRYGAADLPVKLSGWYVARLTPPDVAYTLDGAYAVISNPEAAAIALRAVIVPPELRRQGRATRLFRAIFAAHPGKRWVVPANCPEEIGAELFARCGFARQPISQWQMKLDLTP